MPPEPIVDEDDYASSEDSDFAPDAAADDDRASSAGSDDEDAGQPDDGSAAKQGDKEARAAAKRKQNASGLSGGEAEDAGYDNSGDEAVIGKGKKRRRRNSDGEDGGTGGFIKTRRQRAQEKAERRATATVRGPVTVDVDALWAQMTAGPTQQAQSSQQELASLATAAFAATTGQGHENNDNNTDTAAPQPTDPSDMITIRRTYNFAGQVHTEEKRVARGSAEAKLYLASLEGKADGTEAGAGAETEADGDGEPTKPPPRKAFRSAFEPVLLPDGHPATAAALAALRRTDLDLGLQARLQAREQRAAQDKAKKLNVVEKSRMDWAGYVDKAGIQDELALAGKAKGAFSERQMFLARSDALREEEARRARLAANKV